MKGFSLSRIVPILAVLPALMGCGDPNRVVFVTSTTIGGALEVKEGAAKIAFDRTEGVIGPTLDNGQLPAVYGYLDTDGGILSRNTVQVYATGQAADEMTLSDDGRKQRDAKVKADAAAKAAGEKTKAGTTEEVLADRAGGSAEGSGGSPAGQTAVAKSDNDNLPLCTGKDAQESCRSVGFFGTSTVLGIKIASPSPQGLQDYVLGYRRKEFSILPLTAKRNDKGAEGFEYPATIASLSTSGFADPSVAPGLSTTEKPIPEGDGNAASTAPEKTKEEAAEEERKAKRERAGLGNVQFFASGVAAVNLAQDDDFREAFRRNVNSSVVKNFKEHEVAQEKAALGVLGCYARLAPQGKDEAWKNAMSNNVLGDVAAGQLMMAKAAITKTPAGAPDTASAGFQSAEESYINGIRLSRGYNKERAASLVRHRNKVCELIPTATATPAATPAAASAAPAAQKG